MEMPTEEQLAEWRQKCAAGTMELEEYQQAINWLRQTRGRLPEPVVKAAKEKAAPKVASTDVQAALAAFLKPKV